MTNADLLARLRRRLRDVDATAPLYDDPTLWAYVSDALVDFQVKQVFQTSGYTVDTQSGVSPEAPDDVAMLLVLGAASTLLDDLLRDKVQRGELGVSWESGLERESTSGQLKAYQQGIDGLKSELASITLIRASKISGTRVQ